MKSTKLGANLHELFVLNLRDLLTGRKTPACRIQTMSRCHFPRALNVQCRFLARYVGVGGDIISSHSVKRERYTFPFFMSPDTDLFQIKNIVLHAYHFKKDFISVHLRLRQIARKYNNVTNCVVVVFVLYLYTYLLQFAQGRA